MTESITQFLKSSPVYDYFELHELQIDLIAIDNDILSMECPSTFVSTYLNNSQEDMKNMAHALLKLQVLYGVFPMIDLVGSKAKHIHTLMQSITPTGDSLPVCIAFDMETDACRTFLRNSLVV